MKVKLLLVLIIIASGALILFNLDYVTSVIPGWHTTVYPPFFIAGFLFFWFVLVALLYLFFFRNAFTRNDVLFYLVMTVPCILLALMLKFEHGSIIDGEFAVLRMNLLFVISFLMYAVAQVWFISKIVLRKSSNLKSNS